MAENKKKRTDFKTALSEQAKKLTPKKPSEETLIVDMGEGEFPVVRKNMTDEEWARVKKRAAEYAAKKAASEEDRFSGDELVVKMRDGSKVVVKREDQTDSEWADAVRKSTALYKDSARDIQENFTPPEKRGEGEQWGPGTIYPTKADYLRVKGMVGEEKAAENKRLTDEAKKREEKKATDAQERSEESASADPGMSVRGQMAKMAMGATPRTKEQEDQKYAEEYEASKYVVPQEAKEIAGAVKGAAGAVGNVANKVGSGLADAGGELAAAPGRVGAGLAKAGSELAAVPGKVADTAIDTGMGIAEAMSGIVPPASAESQAAAEQMVYGGGDIDPKRGFRELGAMLGGNQVPPDGEPLPGQVIPPTRNPDGTPKVMPPGAPPASGGTDSVSMSASVTPQVAAPPLALQSGTNGFDAAIGDVKANNQRIKDANDEFLKTSEEALTKREELRNKYALDAERATQDAIQSRLTGVEEAKGLQQRRQMVIERAREAANSPIDPNRFWNNKSDGQKAAAIIAGALFGFTGQGMQWLQRLDGLVEGDNRLQAADRESKVKGLESEAQGLGELAREAIANGASVAEAKLLEKQGKYEGLMAKLQSMTERTNNDQLRVTAAKMYGDMANQVAGLRLQQDQLAELRASHRNEERLKLRDQDIEAGKANAMLRLKAAQGGKGGKKKSISPQLASRVANTEKMIAALKRMKDLAANKGFWDRAKRSGMETLSADERGKYKQYESDKFYVALKRAESSLQKPEQEALLPLLGDRSGFIDSVPALEQAIKASEQALEIDLRTAEDATEGTMRGSGEGVPDTEFPEEEVE